MNPMPYNHTLNMITADTLESLAMMFLVPPEEAPRSSGPLIRSDVTFTGPFGGSVEVGVSAKLLPELAGNMLGTPDPDSLSIEDQHDALKELANVICGNLLPQVGGTAAIFHVNAPRILTGDAQNDGNADWILAGQTQVFAELGKVKAVFRADPCITSSTRAVA